MHVCKLLITCLSITLFSLSCTDSKVADTQNIQKTANERKTQIILRTQEHDYVDAEKAMIKSDYVNHQKVMVPKELTGQNKWFMFEGPVLENDKIAYRFYADYRHRFDIYGKKVSSLVMDTVSWNYHDIMDWGSDILKVGNSLGIGSPAIYFKDSVYTLSMWSSKEIEIVKESDEESILRTTFNELQIEGQTFDVVQDWSLKAGNFWSEIELYVKGGELPEGMKFATGIVKHLDSVSDTQDDECTYLFNYGTQTFHDQEMGMAIIVSNEYLVKKVDDPLSHLLVFDNRNRVKYRFMSMWQNGIQGPKLQDEFKEQLQSACNKI